MPLLVLTSFTKCIVQDYVGPFELVLNTDRVIQLDNDGDGHDDKKYLGRVNKLTLLVSNSLKYSKFSNHWNTPSNHRKGVTKGKVPCDDCDGEHYSPDFLHTRDKAKMNKGKEERAACRDSGGRNSGSGGGRSCRLQG